MSEFTATQERGLGVLAALAGTQELARRSELVALVPAHNEAATIGATIRSLRQQSRRPDQIIVVCDNCTDATEDVALLSGAEVITTVGNTARKAGALNQGLRQVLPGLSGDDLVLMMDADSHLDSDWIRRASLHLGRKRRAGAICGVLRGDAGPGLICQLQRNEYVRAARTIGRMRGVRVLSGCGTLFRVAALREVAEQRGLSLPGTAGHCFNSASLTEDYEMTIALRTLRYACLCSPGSVSVTELMTTWRDLFRQRVRWQRGALGDLRRYGLTRTTLRDWVRQAFGYLSYAAVIACWAVISSSLAAAGAGFNPRWGFGILGVSVTERVWTVRKVGLRGMLLAALILPELGYGLFEAVYLAWSALAEILRLGAAWNHATGDAT